MEMVDPELHPISEGCHARNQVWQAEMLQQVSRSFALTIPMLPAQLKDVVGTAYLLCRIADTIEDDPELSDESKSVFLGKFPAVVEGATSSSGFSDLVVPQLSSSTPDAERILVANIRKVMSINATFSIEQRRILARCVRVMSAGMAEFRHKTSLSGLEDVGLMQRYCYVVAGCVGEMLTDLFCDHSPSIACRRDRLMTHAVTFGQALQMTNILQDVWEDRERGECWLPRDVFADAGLELQSMTPDMQPDPQIGQAIASLVAHAGDRLGRSLEYTLTIPPNEKGIRKFCLTSVLMSVLTLRRILSRLDYTSRDEVKIRRSTVMLVTAFLKCSAGNDRMLRSVFALLAKPLRSRELAPVSL